MKTPDPDPITRLRNADPMNHRPPDEPSSPTAARVFERVGAPQVLKSSPSVRAPRIRASRVLPVLAVAAAVVAVVGLSLPKNTPGPVRETIGAEGAGATTDRADLLRAAEHQDGRAEDSTATQQAGYRSFMADLAAYPEDPTPEHVLTWLDESCDKIGPASSVEEAPGLDCALAAVPGILNEGPPSVAADVLRALATLDGGSPTHADRCSNWASVDPAWKAKVEQAERDLVWVRKNGTRLSISGLARPEVRGFSTAIVAADPEADIFVQCKPSSELTDHPELTVTGAAADYQEAHVGASCSYGEDEKEGLVPIDLAVACGAPVLDAPSTDEVTPTSPDGGSGDVITTIPGGPDVEVRTLPIDPNAVTTTARADANGQSTTMGG